MKLIALVLVCGSCLLTACTGRSKGGDLPRPREAALFFDDLTALLDAERQVQSVIVSRDGEIVYEYHLAGDTADAVHNFYSVAKSVTPDLGLTAVFTSTFTDRKATRPPYIYSEYVVKKLID